MLYVVVHIRNPPFQVFKRLATADQPRHQKMLILKVAELVVHLVFVVKLFFPEPTFHGYELVLNVVPNHLRVFYLA